MWRTKQQGQETKRRNLNWQIPIFLLVGAALALAGVHFKSLATPGKESASLLKPPIVIWPFVNNANITVQLTMVVHPARSCISAGAAVKCQTGSDAVLYATLKGSRYSTSIKSKNKILILSFTSSRPYSKSPLSKCAAQSTRAAIYANPPHVLGYICSLTVNMQAIERELNYGVPIAVFYLPQVTQNANGSFFAHLPEIGWSSSGVATSTCRTAGTPADCGSLGSLRSIPYNALPIRYLRAMNTISGSYPFILDETIRVHGRDINGITIFPNPKKYLAKLIGTVPNKNLLNLLRRPSSYSTIPGSHAQLYWPVRIQTTEILAGAQRALEGSRIDSVLPPNGRLQGDSYVWNGTGSLDATLSATKINAAESQSDNAFFSGVAFAIAVAAAIAFIQELPEAIPLPSWWPRFPKPRRKRNHSRSAKNISSGLGWPG